MRNTFENLLRNDGLKGLWKGNTAGIALYASYNSVQFAVYDRLLNSSGWSFGSGGIAALVATSITYPFDLVRTRMTISKGSNGMFTEFRTIIASNEGFRGLFKGYFLTIGQVVPYMGCIFAAHNILSNNLNLPEFISGASAGFICKTIFMPFDVFRRRLQLFQTQPERFCLDPQVLGYTRRSLNRIDLLKMMWRREGIKSFFRGWSMAVIKSTPVTAITFTMHKFVKEHL